MRLLLLLCLLKLCLVNSIKINSDRYSSVKSCIKPDALIDHFLIIVDKVTKSTSKIIDSVAQDILQNATGIVVDISKFPEIPVEKLALDKISHHNTAIVYINHFIHDNYTKLKRFYSAVTNGVPVLPKMIVVDLDYEMSTTFESVYPGKLSFNKNFQSAPIANSIKCFEGDIVELLDDETLADLNVTSYGNLKKSRLQGPEGKIAQILIESINYTFSIVKSNSSLKAISVQSNKVNMTLSLRKVSQVNSNCLQKSACTWNLIYHPYRTLLLVPLVKCSWSIENYLVYCLLIMVTIMIIVLLHIICRLMIVNGVNDSKTTSYTLLFKALTPTNIFGAIEKILFLSLVSLFFINIGILLEVIFREKFGAHSMESIEHIGDLERLNLSLVVPQKECLHQMLMKKSENIFCIVDEDFGREVIRRYGNDGNENRMKLVNSINVNLEWRGIFLTSPIYLERFNRMQLRFLESGLLDKWYKDEVMINGSDEDEILRSRLNWHQNDRQNERTRIFTHHLMLIIFDGFLMAFFMFVAECIMHGAKMTETRIRYDVYLYDY